MSVEADVESKLLDREAISLDRDSFADDLWVQLAIRRSIDQSLGRNPDETIAAFNSKI